LSFLISFSAIITRKKPEPNRDKTSNIPTGEVPDFSLILGGLGLHIRQEATP